MKILLDECVPIQLRSALSNHDVHSATSPAWRGLSNGALLLRAESEGFNLIIIADKSMRYQQDLSNRKIAILELWTNHRPTLERHSEYIRETAEGIAPCSYLVLIAP
jgi:hypothetical protein